MNTAQRALNEATWSRRSAVESLTGPPHYTDPGERAALAYVADEVRGSPILDLGVGSGRTVSLLQWLTDDYRSLDISPEMVKATRSRYPHAHVELADARTLEGYPSCTFGLVNFSYSGIDAMPPADRRAVLNAVHRVLVPGGIFLFSVLNLNGPSFRERPWRLRIWRTKNPLKVTAQVAAQLKSFPLDLRNWLRIRHSGEYGPGYAVAPLSAHHYAVLAHFTTLDRQLAELEELGYERHGAIFDSRSGNRVWPEKDTSDVDWFHIVARSRELGYCAT